MLKHAFKMVNIDMEHFCYLKKTLALTKIEAERLLKTVFIFLFHNRWREKKKNPDHFITAECTLKLIKMKIFTLRITMRSL